jgi:hypothetical protein
LLVFQLLFLPVSHHVQLLPRQSLVLRCGRPVVNCGLFKPSMDLAGTTTSSTHWTTLCQMRRRVASCPWMMLIMCRGLISDSQELNYI